MVLDKRVLIVLTLAVVLAAVGFLAGWKVAQSDPEPQTEVRRDTIVRVDTITKTEHFHDTITKIKYKKYYVTNTDTLVQHDSVFAVLPYEQHHLVMEDTLDLWYSGVDARVDSLRFYPRSTTIEVVKDVEQPRFAFYGGIGADWFDGGAAYKMFVEADMRVKEKIRVSADGGLAVFDGKASPYVEVTLRYKLN